MPEQVAKAKRLLFSVTKDDLVVQTFCSGGPGGQYQNKVSSGVRIIHLASGAVAESRDDRSQYANKRSAFLKLAASPKFRAWVKMEAGRLACKKTVGEIVDEAMWPWNLRVETMVDGEWVREEAAVGDEGDANV